MSDSEQVRVSKKFWKTQNKCFYCKIIQPNGSRKDRRLDPDEDTAEGIRQDLIKEIKKAGRPSLDCTVDHLIQLFLAHVEANNAEGHAEVVHELPLVFKKSVGTTLRVRDLKLSHVQTWLSKSYPQKTNQNTRHDAIAAVKRLFNWAVRDMEYFDRNPLVGAQEAAADAPRCLPDPPAVGRGVLQVRGRRPLPRLPGSPGGHRLPAPGVALCRGPANRL